MIAIQCIIECDGGLCADDGRSGVRRTQAKRTIGIYETIDPRSASDLGRVLLPDGWSRVPMDNGIFVKHLCPDCTRKEKP